MRRLTYRRAKVLVIKIIRKENFGLSKHIKVTPKTRLEEDLQYDNTDRELLISALEEKTRMDIPDSLMYGFRTVNEIAKYLSNPQKYTIKRMGWRLVRPKLTENLHISSIPKPIRTDIPCFFHSKNFNFLSGFLSLRKN